MPQVTISFETWDYDLIGNLETASAENEGITVGTAGGQFFIDPFTLGVIVR